jgi:hypothetical protein
MPSSLSFVSTSSFRDALMGKNLTPYTVSGVYTPPAGPLNYEVVQSNYSVINSDDNLIANDVFANQSYPLNSFGPNGGYNLNITFNGPLLPITPNQGEYYPLIGSNLQVPGSVFLYNLPTSPAVLNLFKPQNGYFYISYLSENILQNHYSSLYTVYPGIFTPSTYSPYEILTVQDPTGSEGSLSQDSFLAKIGASQLNFLFQERVNAEIYQNTIGLVNLSSLQDPFDAALLATGQQPLINRNWRITVPENPLVNAADFLTRLAGAYWPVSFIPGSYWNENEKGGLETSQTSKALNVVNNLTGGFLGPILNVRRNPSQIFLANSGNGQQSVLFNNLSYNRYQPNYDRGIINGIIQGIQNLLSSEQNYGTYYVGNPNAEPSQITSPSNAIPVNAYGQQVETPVYGPSELGILYEGNDNKLNFGLAGKSFSNDGGIDGGFVWTSPKYQSNAGFRATPGGGSGSKDDEFNQINSQYDKSKSTNVEFKQNSILDNTQRLIDSGDNVSGVNRLKHVGNAMNQVSKVFHDGYREMTKGSQVVSYKDDTTGSEAGIEYCRVFTKDTPYYTYADLQKTDGITTSGRRFSYSVLDNTYNLNIAPLKGTDSTNIVQGDKNGIGGYAKKYMFSIENLAWRTSSRPGYTYDSLPTCEKGPNGGRVMWFPPYNLTFNDSSRADWQPTTFLGRPEPIYTYKNSSREGSISWSIIVDSPSVMNTVVEKQLKGASRERIDSIIDSFFAGCTKFDIYKLAVKFNQIPTDDLYTYQEILNNPRLTDIETLGQINKEIPKNNSSANGEGNSTNSVETNNNNQKVEPDNRISDFENKYLDFALYFDNDIPGPSNSTTSNADYQSTYDTYIGKKDIYKKNADTEFNEGDINRNVTAFFDKVVIGNYNEFCGGEKNFITDAYDILNEKLGKIKVKLQGSASATASPAYNQKLSERRIDAITKFFKEKTVGEKNLSKFIDDKTFQIISEKGFGEEIVIPRMGKELGSDPNKPIETEEDSGTGEDVNCSQDIKNKNNKVTTISQVYAANAMACRRVKIKEISVEPIPKEPAKPEPVKEVVTTPNTPTSDNITLPVNPVGPSKSIIKKLKEGISKKILRNLLSECDYFEVIKENVPMVYDSIKEKIKYFNPAFHSMTPEGLNARLTFLNQCLRPGETIPIIQDGQPTSVDAINTSFGAPPVLVLRIGDFYNTKIIPTSLQVTYDPLLYDMNPEGIGVQPMIAKIQLSFNMIGGMGLKEPVEQLQNALSFNYYANTEIYDERATATEDTSKLDKEIIDQIEAISPSTPVNNTADTQPQDIAGSTIGEIKSTEPLTPSGETGEISYLKVMDKLLDTTKTYYENTFNSLEEVVKQSNYGILQYVSKTRNFSKGNFKTPEGDLEAEIFGKPNEIASNLDKLFDVALSDIDSGNNPIIKYIVDKKLTDPTTITVLKNNLRKYVLEVKNEMINTVSNISNSKLGQQQQEYVQGIRAINVVVTKTDGKIDEKGVPKIYNLSETDKVSPTGLNFTYSNTFDELTGDFKLLRNNLNAYIKALTDSSIIPPTNFPDGSFGALTEFKTVNDKTFFLVVGRRFNDKNKVEDFKKVILTQSITSMSSNKKMIRKFDDYVDDLAKQYKKEIKEEENLYKKYKEADTYKSYINNIETNIYKKGKTRIFNFTTVPVEGTNEQQKTDIIDLYKGDKNKISDLNTFDGKIKFN